MTSKNEMPDAVFCMESDLPDRGSWEIRSWGCGEEIYYHNHITKELNENIQRLEAEKEELVEALEELSRFHDMELMRFRAKQALKENKEND